eukprot:GSChrysophyteH2.ASY1.ANO1.1106.1 assembled CDS
MLNTGNGGNNSAPVVAGARLNGNIKGCYFTPSDSRFGKIYVPRLCLPEAFQNDPFSGLKQIYIVTLAEDWSVRSRMPQAADVRSIGEFGSIATETEALLIQANCNHQPYSEDAVEPLPSGWNIPPAEVAKRRDLRDTRIFTIDPPNAKDLDDALHITPLDDGTYEIGVHIADVSYFLQPNTSLDEEAQKRATSVYLVQKVIPMLPSILCEQLCSLNPNVDRLAFSCIWRMNADGTLVDGVPPWYGKTIIRSCAKLDYPTAQRMIEGVIPSQPDSGADPGTCTHAAWQVSRDVVLMRNIAKHRRKSRIDNGALVLTNSKLTFVLDSKGNPVTTGTYTIRESNQLVEEYMLLANYLVSQELLLKYGDAAFIRNHGQPDAAGMKSLQEVFSGTCLGYDMDVTSSASIQACLNNIGQTADAETLRIVSIMLAKPIPEAQYIVAGEDPAAWRHYALSIPYYTHFTSPIRRYADVMVHRLLEASVAADAAGAAAIAQSTAIAAQCNEMKRASKDAQTRSDRVFFAIYLKDHPMDVSGCVIGIGEKSFTVLVPEYGIEERLFVDNMVGVTSVWNPSEKTLQLHRAPALPGAAPLAAVMPSQQPDTLTFTGSLHLKILSPVKVHFSAKMRAPIDLSMTLIGPDTNGSAAIALVAPAATTA